MNIYEEQGMRRVINACGRMTKLGVSTVEPKAGEVMQRASQDYVMIDELMEWAGGKAAQLFSCGGACVCGSASSGIFLAIASLLCQGDIGKIKYYHQAVQNAPRDQIIMPLGHDIDYGAPIREMIYLAGVKIQYAGFANTCSLNDIQTQINDHTLAVLFVKSHHCVQKNMPDIYEVIRFAREKEIPCIVDAAAEEDLEGYVHAGADYVVYSGSKAVCGPTSGIVLCRERSAAEHMRLQYQGVGRLVKTGKENIMGLMEALCVYKGSGAEKKPAVTYEDLCEAAERISRLSGCRGETIQDEAGRNIFRCRIHLKPAETGISAVELKDILEEGNPAIFLRDYLATQGSLDIDPRPLKGKDELWEIINRIESILEKVQEEK